MNKINRVDIAAHMSDAKLCHAFLRVAEACYPELLAGARSDAARALSSWLMLDGHRAWIEWSDEDDCFIGCLRDVGKEIVSFHGKTPIGLQQAFEKAVREFKTKQAKERQSTMALPEQKTSYDVMPSVLPQTG